MLVCAICIAWLPLHAAITPVGFTEETTTGKVTSLPLSRPGGVVAGDLLLALVVQAKSGSITAPAGWTSLAVSDGTRQPRMAVFWRVVVASEPATYTFNSSIDEEATGGISAFRGVDTSSPIAASAIQPNASSSTSSTPSISPAVANTMLVGFWGTGKAITPPASMVESIGLTVGKGVKSVSAESAYETRAATGATGARIASIAGNTTNNAALVALRPLSVVDHYELSLPSAGLACLSSSVIVTACSNSSSPCTSAATTVAGQTATLSTFGATLGSGTVTFNAAGVANTTLSFPSASNGSVAAVTLSGETAAASNARQCCPNGSACAAANSCSITFNTAGFIIAGSAGGASTTLPAQTAGAASAGFVLRAVRSSSTAQACEAALTGASNVNWAYECNNPDTCSAGNLLTLSGSSGVAVGGYSAGGVGAGSSVPMVFDANGNAPFSFNYRDAGQVTLYASKAASGALLSALSGVSNAFVVKPAGFTLSGIQCSTYAAGSCATAAIASPGNNPAASSATGAAFLQAGQAFSATVAAVDAAGGATPNYGREKVSPEGVKLTASLVQPVGGAVGALANASGFGSFVNGVATGTGFSWSEVGIIRLTPSVADGDYLGAGDVVGAVSGNVGRFIPDHFDTQVTQGCSAGAFSYSAQPMTVRIAAMNGLAIPAATVNYGGTTFAKAATLSDANGVAGGTLSGTAVAATAFAAGVATTTTPAFTYALASTAPAVVKLRVIDSDGVSSLRTAPASSVEGISEIRSGRVQLQNAYGSERLALALPVRLQYWNNGWLSNTQDTCTSISASQFAWAFPTGVAARPNNLSACESALTVTGAAPNYSVSLNAPGAGNAGWSDLTLNLGSSPAGSACTSANSGAGFTGTATTANTPWLQFNWTGTPGNPKSRATFGVFKSPTVYSRENY